MYHGMYPIKHGGRRRKLRSKHSGEEDREDLRWITGRFVSCGERCVEGNMLFVSSGLIVELKNCFFFAIIANRNRNPGVSTTGRGNMCAGEYLSWTSSLDGGSVD